MRRSTNGGMRLVQPEDILKYIPDYAPKVGLVGAAISDHPKLVELLDTLVRNGKGVGISSLRADRVSRRPDIARLLRESGARTPRSHPMQQANDFGVKLRKAPLNGI